MSQHERTKTETYKTKLIQGMYHFSLFFYEKNQTLWRSPNSEGINESGMFSCWSMFLLQVHLIHGLTCQDNMNQIVVIRSMYKYEP
jgi:hypothetical protein